MWGGGDLEKNPNLMKWVMVCLDKRDGGWGVRSLVMLNKALLGKWSWRFLMIETLFGGKSFVGSSEKKVEVGAHVTLEELMG